MLTTFVAVFAIVLATAFLPFPVNQGALAVRLSFSAVVVCAWYGGTPTGLFAALVHGVGCALFARRSWDEIGFSVFIEITGFVFVALIIGHFRAWSLERRQ